MPNETRCRAQLASFAVTKVWNREIDRAIRLAALYPLLQPQWQEQPGGTRAAIATNVLVKVRRAKLVSLRTHGNRRVKAGGIFLLNCPPFSVSTRDKMHSCGWYRWCPFCWGRENVGETYGRLLAALFPAGADSDRNELAAERFELSVGVREDVLPFGSDLSATLGELQGSLANFRAAVKHYGGLALAALAPHPEGYLASQRFLSLTPLCAKWKPFGAWNGEPFRVTLWGALNRTKLAEAAGLYGAYPVGLFNGDPREVNRVLAMLEEHRLSQRYGVLRRVKSRELFAGAIE